MSGVEEGFWDGDERRVGGVWGRSCRMGVRGNTAAGERVGGRYMSDYSSLYSEDTLGVFGLSESGI